MLTEVIRQQITLDQINRLLRFLDHLFETHPYQNGTADVISYNPGLAALTSFQSSNLLGLMVKLLNLPTQAAHILYGLNAILSQVIRSDIVRALGILYANA